MGQTRRIGFIGLGMMGAPMVQCLAHAGFELFVDDADARAPKPSSAKPARNA